MRLTNDRIIWLPGLQMMGLYNNVQFLYGTFSYSCSKRLDVMYAASTAQIWTTEGDHCQDACPLQKLVLYIPFTYRGGTAILRGHPSYKLRAKFWHIVTVPSTPGFEPGWPAWQASGFTTTPMRLNDGFIWLWEYEACKWWVYMAMRLTNDGFIWLRGLQILDFAWSQIGPPKQ